MGKWSRSKIFLLYMCYAALCVLTLELTFEPMPFMIFAAIIEVVPAEY